MKTNLALGTGATRRGRRLPHWPGPLLQNCYTPALPGAVGSTKPPIRKLIEDLETILAILEAHEHPRFQRDILSEPGDFEVISRVLELDSKRVRVMGGLAGDRKDQVRWGVDPTVHGHVNGRKALDRTR